MHLFHSHSTPAATRHLRATARSTRPTLWPLSADGAVMAAGILRWTMVLSLIRVAATSGNGDKCCLQQQPAISDCSFNYYDTEDMQSRNVSCDLKEGRKRGYVHGSCPDYGYTSKDNIPGQVKKLKVEPFVTSCPHTISNETPLMASACNTSCREYRGEFFYGINITFKADEPSAEQLEGIEISLRKMSWESGVRVWCAMMHIGETGLRWDAASQHTFYYDGFIGLEPTAEYDVTVKTLPTSADSTNAVTSRITIPEETCWRPDIEYHDTPFTLNFTLFNDAQSALTQFQTLVHQSSKYLRRQVDFNASGPEYFAVDGKLATNLVFNCLLPDTDVKLFIRSPQCPYCQWYDRTITIQGKPPEVRNCPSDIVIEVELGNTTEVGPLNWKEPDFISPCSFPMGVNRSHAPRTSTFPVGKRTLVTYHARQHDIYMSECSFTVEVNAVDTTLPKFLSCPDDMTYVAEAGQDGLKITWPEPEVWDASPTAVKSTIPSGSWFPVGENITVAYSVVDEAGNGPVKCEFHVYIKETPTAPLPVIIVACTVGGSLAGCILAIGLCQRRRRNRSSGSSEELQEKKKENNHFERDSEPVTREDYDLDSNVKKGNYRYSALSLTTVHGDGGVPLDYLRKYMMETSPAQELVDVQSCFEKQWPFNGNLASPLHAVSTPNIVLSSSMGQSHSDNNYRKRCHDPMSGFSLLGGGREGQSREPYFGHRVRLEVIEASGSSINVPVMQT